MQDFPFFWTAAKRKAQHKYAYQISYQRKQQTEKSVEPKRERKCVNAGHFEKKMEELTHTNTHELHLNVFVCVRTQRTFDFACNWAYERDFCIWALLGINESVARGFKGCPGPDCPVWIHLRFPRPLTMPLFSGQQKKACWNFKHFSIHREKISLLWVWFEVFTSNIYL